MIKKQYRNIDDRNSRYIFFSLNQSILVALLLSNSAVLQVPNVEQYVTDLKKAESQAKNNDTDLFLFPYKFSKGKGHQSQIRSFSFFLQAHTTGLSVITI